MPFGSFRGMNLAVCVLTRFELRSNPEDRDGLFGVDGATLFNPERLRSRLNLIQWITGPSLRAQSHQDFLWAILYDVDLPRDLLAELEAFAATMPQIRLVSNEGFFADHLPVPERGMGGMGWLRPLLPEDATHVLTINVDDDDALGRHALRRLVDQVNADKSAGKLDHGLRFYGWAQSTHWWASAGAADDSPLGWWWDWGPGFRESEMFRSVGFSVCTSVSFSVHTLGFPHHIPHVLQLLEVERRKSFLGRMFPRPWLRFQMSAIRGRFSAQARRQMRGFGRLVQRKNQHLTPTEQITGLPGEWVADAFCGSGEVLMLEHDSNVMMTRRKWSAVIHQPVADSSFLGDVVVDWDQMQSHIQSLAQ